MTNYEVFKDEIIKLIASGKQLSVRSGKPVGCSFPCYGCLFYDDEANGEKCELRRRNWLESECKELVKLNEQERLFCEMIEEGYLTRDANNALYWYEKKPLKSGIMWQVFKGKHCCLNIGRLTVSLFKDNLHFDFIKWEDEEPWSVKELLEMQNRTCR